jgi:hypothetical protein
MLLAVEATRAAQAAQASLQEAHCVEGTSSAHQCIAYGYGGTCMGRVIAIDGTSQINVSRMYRKSMYRAYVPQINVSRLGRTPPSSPSSPSPLLLAGYRRSLIKAERSAQKQQQADKRQNPESPTTAPAAAARPMGAVPHGARLLEPVHQSPLRAPSMWRAASAGVPSKRGRCQHTHLKTSQPAQ